MWAAGIVAATCKLPARAGKVLGVEISGDTLEEQLLSATAAVDATCDALAQVEDPPAGLAFLRVLANVGRMAHLLQAARPELPQTALEEFDAQQARALGGVLGGPLPATAVDRATCAASDGGLGLRRAVDLRFPAFLASRAEARGLAEEVLDVMPEV